MVEGLMLGRERAPYRFTAKERERGEHAIAFEPLNDALSVLSHFRGLLTLDLKPGLSIYEARALAKLLNERVEGLGASIP
jgi:hypothetical protein